MDYSTILRAENIAIKVNELPFNDSFLSFSKVKLVLFSKGQDDRWLSMDKKLIVDIEDIYNSEFIFENYILTVSDIGDLFDLQRFVFNQYDLYHIVDRHNKFNKLGLPELDIKINELIIKCLCLLKTKKIDLLIGHDTPHNPNNYILFQSAKALGIPVLNIRQSPLPWRSIIEQGLGKDVRIIKLVNKPEVFDREMVESYLKSLNSHYHEAIPDYEKERHTKYKGALWSWRKEIRRYLKYKFAISYIKKSLQKLKTLKLLLSYASEVNLNSPYVVFFLHYQPERTTLPEGDIFNQQLFAIQSLRTLLPKDVQLVVREHPSTFRNKFIKKYRPDMLYNELYKMSGVLISSPYQNPFDLLDKSIFVSTISGTVGVESVIRGKCCVYFGNASYKDMPSAYHIDEVWKDRNLMVEILSKRIEPTRKETHLYFNEMLTYTFGASSTPNNTNDYKSYLVNASEALSRILLYSKDGF